MARHLLFCFFLFLFIDQKLCAIEKDSAKTTHDSIIVKKHSPRKATIYSAVLPGLGQAYNKKYWKIPVIYAGFAGLGYWFVYEQRNYKTYYDALKLRLDNNPSTIDDFEAEYSTEDLQTLKEYYARYRDLSVISLTLCYVINVVDAAVDAHLFSFDVSDNLTLKVEPIISPIAIKGIPPATGLNFRLQF